ncbi:MAG: cell division protein FtsJ [Alicyclobacillus sp.]|nr:cell division protein FtsJ [Alicyclobacillus sp.]
MNVYLDDWRPCPKSFTVVRDYEECILLLSTCDVNILSLDYHLGTDKTGLDVAKWIVRHKRWPKEIRFHSSDPAGREKMRKLLQRHAPKGVVIR